MAPGTPASSAWPSLGPRVKSPRPLDRSASAAGRVPSPAEADEVRGATEVRGRGWREQLADAHQRPERVRQGQDLARAAHSRAGYGRYEASAQEGGQPQAQPGGYAGVAGQERAQPDGDDRARVGRFQPRRASGRPAQEQVALVRKLLGLGETDARQGAHAGIHAVHGIAAAQHVACGGALAFHLLEQGGRDLDPLPGGDLEDPAGIQVAGRADQCLPRGDYPPRLPRMPPPTSPSLSTASLRPAVAPHGAGASGGGHRQR